MRRKFIYPKGTIVEITDKFRPGDYSEHQITKYGCTRADTLAKPGDVGVYIGPSEIAEARCFEFQYVFVPGCGELHMLYLEEIKKLDIKKT